MAKIRSDERLEVEHVQLLIAAINEAASESSDEKNPGKRSFTSLEGQSLEEIR